MRAWSWPAPRDGQSLGDGQIEVERAPGHVVAETADDDIFLAAGELPHDEIGYLPVVPGGGNLFFQLVNARYEKGAMILTSNGGFAEWGEVFGDPVVATALLDRLLHHAVALAATDLIAILVEENGEGAR